LFSGLLELVALADVVKVSDEDLSWLCPGRPVEDVASEWLACGPDLVVVTRGRDGADAFGGWGTHHSAPRTTVVADTIGAGDSFMAGLLFALVDHGVTPTGERIAQLDRTAITQSVDFATRCAAITVGRPGADPPRRDEVH
jgi:fructokinase